MERVKRKWETGERAAFPVFIYLLIFFSSFSLAPFVARAPLPEHLEQARLGLYSHYTG